MLGLTDPTAVPLVKLTLSAIRRDKGVAQRQAVPLRFKGAVRDVERDPARGLNVRALLDACGEDLTGLRDRALLSLAYDTGRRVREPVAVQFEEVMEAIDPEARLLRIARSKGDQEGEGATAYLSPCTVRAVAAWTAAAEIGEGPLFRRVIVRRYKARAWQPGRKLATIRGGRRGSCARPCQAGGGGAHRIHGGAGGFAPGLRWADLARNHHPRICQGRVARFNPSASRC